MNFSTAAVIVAAVAACNGRDPLAAPAAKVPAVELDAAPVARPVAVMVDARPSGADGDAAARRADAAADGVGDLPLAPEVEAFHGSLPALPMLSPTSRRCGWSGSGAPALSSAGVASKLVGPPCRAIPSRARR